MKHFSKVILCAAVALSFVACQKEDSMLPENTENHATPDTPVVTNPDLRDPYLGTYDITLVYDSIAVDGVWLTNEFAYSVGRGYDPDYGYLVITKSAEDSLTVILDGCIVYPESNDTVPFYTTTAKFDEQGRLVPNTNSLYVSGYHYTVQYTPIVLGDNQLTFRTLESYPIGASLCEFVKQATCIKRTIIHN